MNPDPNQPQGQPEGQPLTPPQEPTLNPTPDLSSIPVEQPVEAVPSVAEAPVVAPVDAPAPAVEPVAPVETPAANPFASAAPVSSEQPAAPNPFAAASEPAAPVVAGAVIGSAPVDPLAAPAPAQKSKKGLVILISAIVGGLLVVGGIAAVVYFMFFSITKADYQAAYDQLTIVRDKYSAGSNVSSGSTEESLKTTETAYAEFKTENAKLGDLKALKADKELNTAYKAYDTKAKAFIAFGDALMPSLSQFVQGSNEIKALGTGASSFTSANIQKTIDVLKGLDVSDPTLKTYLTAAIAAYEEILPQAKIYESTTATNAQKYAAISAISDSADKVLKAATTMTKDLKTNEEAVDLKDQLNELGKAVTAKLNAAK